MRVTRQVQSAIKLHQAGQLAAARAQYEDVLRRWPTQPDALHFFGVLEHHQGNSAAGVAAIRASLTVAPSNAHAWLNLGNIFFEGDECGEAKAAYERAAALAPKLADAWHNLGVCLRKMEDPAAAVTAFDRALGARPSHAPSFYQRGIAQRESGDLPAAEADFRQALRLDPGCTTVYESLGMLLYRQNRIADAADIYRAWSRLDPTSPTAAHLAAATSGVGVPERGSDAYVAETFDAFAATFDQNLTNLGYRGPELVAAQVVAAVSVSAAEPAHALFSCVLDAGCGTGLCASLLRPLAKRLVGVDLSTAMVAAARAKAQYDEIHVAELGAFMRGYAATFDAVVAADTFIYFGALEDAMAAAAHCMQPGGVLVFTLEEMSASVPENYRLEPHGRYSHHLDYVCRILEQTGFDRITTDRQVLRRERGVDVIALVVAARRCADNASDGSLPS